VCGNFEPAKSTGAVASDKVTHILFSSPHAVTFHFLPAGKSVSTE
jgi:hypothetical protein